MKFDILWVELDALGLQFDILRVKGDILWARFDPLLLQFDILWVEPDALEQVSLLRLDDDLLGARDSACSSVGVPAPKRSGRYAHAFRTRRDLARECTASLQRSDSFAE